MATSMTRSKPRDFMAVTNFPGETLPLNWPIKAGATMAMTRSPCKMDWITWKIWLLSTMAPKGHVTRH